MGFLILIIVSIIGFKINTVIGFIVLCYGLFCLSASNMVNEPKKDNMETYYTFRFGPFSITKKDKGEDR